MPRKSILWVGSSLDDLRDFPAEARREAGHELYLVQLGLEPSDWKPMPSVGPGAMELRIHTGVEHRVFYVAKFSEGVYVLHAFQKTTRRTRQADIDVAKDRLRAVTAHRRHEEGSPRKREE